MAFVKEQRIYRERTTANNRFPDGHDYLIYAEGQYLIIDNELPYDGNESVTLDKEDQEIVLFALAELLGYRLTKEEA